MSERPPLLVTVLTAVLLGPGCMMITGKATVQGRSGAGVATSSRVPVALAVHARVYQDGLHVSNDERGEEYLLSGLLGRSLGDAGIMGESVARPTARSLNLLVEVKEERTGPIGLKVASAATFRVLPNWTNIRYRLEARGQFRGRPIESFSYENTATLIENLLLFPVAPFFAPERERQWIRRQAVQNLTAHLTAVLAEAAQTPKGGKP